MTLATSILRKVSGPESVGEEALCLLVGAGFTLLLFLGLARFEDPGIVEQPQPIEDLRAVAVPLEPPPPPEATDVVAPAEPAGGLVGLEIGAAESPVHIAVVPPDLAALFPPVEAAPPARIQVGRLYPELKPHVDVDADFRRVFQQSEVDRIPTVLYRAAPKVPRYVRQNAPVLRVTLLLVVDQNGIVASVRVLKPSGNAQFDGIVSECVETEWAFTPAIKSGKKVKCLLQQSIVVKWERGTPFET